MNFGLTGVAGYIAPRHLQAIKETGNNLVACLDPHDSVGLLDRYFSNTAYFRETERFDRHIEMLRHQGHDDRVDYISICSPNHLHDAHIRMALRAQADAICEKPLVLNPWNLDALEEMEKEYQKRVYSILQLRVHPSLVELKKQIQSQNMNTRREVRITYITSRGPWYHYSWKGDLQKSGGVATNIGIHFFDLVMWLFGGAVRSELHLSENSRAAGFIELKDANVTWYLSVDRADLPEEAIAKNRSTYRSITVDGKEIEFTDGFTDLHTVLYKKILEGTGFGISETRPSIEVAYGIRTQSVVKNPEMVHPFVLNMEKD